MQNGLVGSSFLLRHVESIVVLLSFLVKLMVLDITAPDLNLQVTFMPNLSASCCLVSMEQIPPE